MPEAPNKLSYESSVSFDKMKLPPRLSRKLMGGSRYVFTVILISGRYQMSAAGEVVGASIQLRVLAAVICDRVAM